MVRAPDEARARPGRPARREPCPGQGRAPRLVDREQRRISAGTGNVPIGRREVVGVVERAGARPVACAVHGSKHEEPVVVPGRIEVVAGGEPVGGRLTLLKEVDRRRVVFAPELVLANRSTVTARLGREPTNHDPQERPLPLARRRPEIRSEYPFAGFSERNARTRAKVLQVAQTG